MAATAFCQVSNGYGIRQEHPVNRHALGRRYSSLSTQHAEKRTFNSYNLAQKCYDKTFTSMLVSKRESGHRRSLLKCKAELSVAPVQEETEKGEELSRATLIWRAAKLPMYTVALIPVTVATAAAYLQTGLFSSTRYFMMLASYIIVNIWVNLSNDVYDFDTGADKNKKESVVNLFGGRTVISVLAWSLLVIGFSGLSWMAVQAGSPRSIVLLAAAVFGFYLYQCPPFRLSYYGVGEPLLFLAYGPLSTIAFYLLHSTTSELPISPVIVWTSVLIGLTTSLILFCSHFHQIKDDKAVGKISPLVRLGTETGSKVVKMSVVGLYSVLLGLGFTQTLPLPTVILSAMTLPVANAVVGFVEKNHKDNSKIFMGKYLCVRLHTIFGLALAAGLVAARIVGGQQFQEAAILKLSALRSIIN